MKLLKTKISRNFNNSKIISIDLKDIEPIRNLVHIKGDFTEEHHKKNIHNYFGKKVDLIMSDMAVNTTGNKSVRDQLIEEGWLNENPAFFQCGL